MADYHARGRGRLSHRWQSPPGSALLVAFVLQSNALRSLAAGIAAGGACGRGGRLKWPNDLLLDSRKVGGILVEASPSRAVCGIGINLSWAPEDAAKLDEPRAELLERLRAAMERCASAPAAEVLARWRELSHTIDQKVRVELPDRIAEGTVQDIDQVGKLVVDGTPISAGSVTVLGG